MYVLHNVSLAGGTQPMQLHPKLTIAAHSTQPAFILCTRQTITKQGRGPLHTLGLVGPTPGYATGWLNPADKAWRNTNLMRDPDHIHGALTEGALKS